MSGYIQSDKIQKIHENMEELKKKIEEFHIDQSKENCPTLAVLIGGTGSGKSTFMHILANKKLIVKEDSYKNKILESETSWDEFKIGHDHSSETEIPGIWFDRKRNVIFCDCPGFFDTKGSAQDIVNIFSIVTLLNQVKKVKLVLMISQDVGESYRAQNSKKQFDIVNKMSEVKFSEKGICMIITQTEEELRTPRKIEAFLDGMGAFDEKEEPVLNILAKESEKRIFILENPEELEVNEEYNKFTEADMERFMKFINNKNDYYKPKDKVPLNESALLFILSVINSLDRMNSIIHEFVIQMINDYETEIEQSPEELDKWKNIVMNFKKKEYESLNNFSSELKEIFQKEEYQAIYKKIEHIQFLLSIFDKIDFNELSPSDARSCSHFMKSVSNESITKNFQKELQVIEKEIDNEDKRRTAVEERLQECNKRVEAEKARLQAENRASEIEVEKKKIMDELSKKEKKLREHEKNQKEIEAKKKKLEDEQKQIAATRQKSQEEIQLLQKQVEAIQKEQSQPIHVHCSSSGPCNIF